MIRNDTLPVICPEALLTTYPPNPPVAGTGSDQTRVIEVHHHYLSRSDSLSTPSLPRRPGSSHPSASFRSCAMQENDTLSSTDALSRAGVAPAVADSLRGSGLETPWRGRGRTTSF